MTGDERTKDLLARIKTILAYVAPELQLTRLARLVIDEQGALVAENDQWFARWLRENSTCSARVLAERVESGEHWRWIQAGILKEESEMPS